MFSVVKTREEGAYGLVVDQNFTCAYLLIVTSRQQPNSGGTLFTFAYGVTPANVVDFNGFALGYVHLSATRRFVVSEGELNVVDDLRRLCTTRVSGGEELCDGIEEVDQAAVFGSFEVGFESLLDGVLAEPFEQDAGVLGAEKVELVCRQGEGIGDGSL